MWLLSDSDLVEYGEFETCDLALNHATQIAVEVKKFPVRYVRVWGDTVLTIDYGSHSHFFYVFEVRTKTLC